jgi:hypothetical protein
LLPGAVQFWCFTLLCALGSTVAAQWLSLPAAQAPRVARTENQSERADASRRGRQAGSFRHLESRQPPLQRKLLPSGHEAPMLPAAAELYEHRVATMGYDRPMTRCCRTACRMSMTVPGLPFKILQVPGVTLVLFEEFSRVIGSCSQTDGSCPKTSRPGLVRLFGRPLGGDTFVVDTAGFKEGSWLDNRRPSALRGVCN